VGARLLSRNWFGVEATLANAVGASKPLRAVEQTRRSIGIGIDAAVGDVIEQASNRREGS